MDTSVCKICSRAILPHAYCLRCCYCEHPFHINCLKLVDKNDPLYVNRLTNKWICPICTVDLFPFNHYDEDDEFIRTLRECTSDHDISFADLQNKIFNPFDLNENVNSPLYDTDPDIQYYNEISHSSSLSCDYYMEDTFNAKCGAAGAVGESFSVIHSNIRSVPSNLANFEHFCLNLDLKFSVIALSETWLSKDNADCYGIQGYNGCHKYREGRGCFITSEK